MVVPVQFLVLAEMENVSEAFGLLKCFVCQVPRPPTRTAFARDISPSLIDSTTDRTPALAARATVETSLCGVGYFRPLLTNDPGHRGADLLAICNRCNRCNRFFRVERAIGISREVLLLSYALLLPPYCSISVYR